MLLEFADIRQASIAAVEQIVSIAKSAVSNKGFCTIVLAGGSTPKQIYELLSEPGNAEQMPWTQSHFFWGDERWVASTHPDSNFLMAQKALLSKVQIPPQNIHQITTGHKKPAAGAALYEEHLRNFFQSIPLEGSSRLPEDDNFPVFDLILLGMGGDGHTASLFPGSEILNEKDKWVADVPAGIGSPPVPRITLTLPLLNQADNIFFLVAGKSKIAILDTILTNRQEAETLYPAARIRPAGELVWFAAENY